MLRQSYLRQLIETRAEDRVRREELGGKGIMVLSHALNVTHEHVIKYLRRFHLTWTLRRIGELEAGLSEESAADIGDHTAIVYALPYLALVAIEVSDDSPSKRIPTLDELAHAARMVINLPEKDLEKDPLGLLIRMGYSQFTNYDRLQAIARTLIIYRDLWSKVPAAQKLNIEQGIKESLHLGLDGLLIFCLMYTTRAANGYVQAYDESAAHKAFVQLGVTSNDERTFLETISASYAQFRREVPRAVPGLEKYRPNPLLHWPLIRPDVIPTGVKGPLYLTPSSSRVLRRLTEGLFYDLQTRYRATPNSNLFKIAFGQVFEQYVGLLLRDSHGVDSVLSEFSYGPKNNQRMTPDWLVLEGERLTVIEAKHSVLSVELKATGKLADVGPYWMKTVGRGVQQLLTFQHDLEQRVKGLEGLSHVNRVELLVVTNDKCPFANSIMRKYFEENGIAKADQVQICDVAEFESLQKHCWGHGLLRMLRAKRTDIDGSKMAFEDWLYRQGKPRFDIHPVLGKTFDAFLQSHGLDVPS